MKTHKKQSFRWLASLCMVCLWLLSVNLCAQVKCANRLLADLHGQLSEKYIQEDVVGEVMIPSLCPNNPLVIEKTSQGVISHIGVKLFDRGLVAKHPSLLYPFIERYFLELLLLPNNQEIMTKLKMERVKITSSIHSMVSVKEGLRKIAAEFSSNLSFSIICRNNRYVFSCIDKGRVLMEMSFPVRYELIGGYTKLEAESAFYPDLLMYKETEYLPLAESELFAYQDSLYSFNEDYYLTEDFISTSYYKKVEEGIVPILSSEMLAESVYNLFNTGYDWGIEVEVTQNMYGGKKRTFNIPLSKLIQFLNQQNCLVYTGIQKYDKSIIGGSLMAANMELGYQHLMQFSFPKELIDHPKEHLVKIKIYSFIPIHNISSLFDNKSKIK